MRAQCPTAICIGPQVPVADTVGCGDSFAAAIVLGYTQRKPLPPVLALSNAVGAATATLPGAGRNVASADTIRRLLSQQAAAAPATGQFAAVALSIIYNWTPGTQKTLLQT